MLNAGKAVKVSIYLSEGSTHHGVPTYSSHSRFSLLPRRFGRDRAERSRRLWRRSPHALRQLPSRSPIICPSRSNSSRSREKVNELLGKLEELAGTGMIEIQETTVAKPAQESKAEEAAASRAPEDRGKASMMRIYIGEADRWNDKPLHKALVEAMRANDIAGVTVYRGILGYGAHRRIHKDKPLHLSHDCSIMLSAVDTEEKLQVFLPLVDQMVEEGLVVLSDVDIIKYSYRPLETGDRPKQFQEKHTSVSGGSI